MGDYPIFARLDKYPNVVVERHGTVYKEVDGVLQNLPPRDDGRGYHCVTVTNQHGNRETRKVHQLVYEAFHGCPPFNMHIDHVDHNKKNNAVQNLRLRPIAENSADCRKTSRKGQRVLTAKQRDMLILLCQHGYTTKEISCLAGVGETTVRRLKRATHPVETPHG
jgi:DNA-binding CsgD family transcriptional regulator